MFSEDEWWIEHALRLAERAKKDGEVPVGALVVYQNQVIGEGWNQPISASDPTAHAEIIALRAAARQMNNYRLPGTVLYASLEPCVMCVGALIHARVSKLVFGAFDPKTGAAGSRFDLLADPRHNHHLDYYGGILAQKCAEQLRQFFQERRAAQTALAAKRRNLVAQINW